MKPALRHFFLISLMSVLVILASCTNPPASNGGGGGGGNGGGGGGNGGGGGGSGSYTIGGQVTGLVGTGLVLQDNSGDNLPISANGPFTFKTAVSGAYDVTVLTQPSNPTQGCTVANPSGTAAANVGNIVVTCSSGTISIGGYVSGLAGGTGLALQDNGGDNLTISANGSFTFKTLLVSGEAYIVTILTQPTNPAQTCAVTNGKGTATANVTNVQVICPAVFYTVGGQVVGLYVPTGKTSAMVLQDNGGDNLPITGDGAFTFVTPIAYGSTYDVDIFVGSGTQPQGCIVWNYEGTVTGNVTTVIVDCGHNDWTWMDGDNKSDQYGQSTTPPPTPPTVDTDTPGGTRYPATWTDLSGNLWKFSGYGYAYKSSIPDQPSFFDEMWEYTGTQNYFGSYGNLWQMVAAPVGPDARWGAVTWTDPTTGHLWLFGGQDCCTDFLNDLWDYNTATNTWTYHAGGYNMPGVYGTKGTPGGYPGGRWGASYRMDASGNVWMFGGFGCDSTASACSNGLLNDLWEYSTAAGTWTWVSGSNVMNQDGVYGTLGTASSSNVPGGRQASVAWTDTGGNFWLFGGYNLSPQGQPNAFNDLWEYSGGQWTWVAGANVVNQTGVYGTQGVAATTNVPGARWSPAAWSDVDVSGYTRLWIFGGQGYDATGNGTLADLWVFKLSPSSPGAKQWTWVKGPSSVSQAGIYGLQENPIVWPYVVDNPGARWGAGYWTDPYGQFWMFGGEGFDSTGTSGDGLLNDLWRYLPYPD